ncbi:MAG: pyridoxine 5'-phosphate synthase [Alphaproteobacteria bacterium]|nr:pyridoxine 5'-phosphate synthase [Alphaproteobacteria bacterium]
MRQRLGVNIDHVATIRNARGGGFPDPVRAAKLAAQAGADGITAHLREDRRHISDDDIERLSREIDLPLNLEMAATDEMLQIALKHRPHAACIVPEKREERTTEGGIDAAGQQERLAPFVKALGDAGIRVSLFIESDSKQLEAAARLGAPVVELHTGAYCDSTGAQRDEHLRSIESAARFGASIGLEIHAGHGLTYETVAAIAAIPQIRELNIGHFLVGEAIFVGLDASVRQMRVLMDETRLARSASG